MRRSRRAAQRVRHRIDRARCRLAHACQRLPGGILCRNYRRGPWTRPGRQHLQLRERLAAAWFGPKDFASVVYGLLILISQVTLSDELFHLTALVVVASIVAHSSTDVVIARWFEPKPDPNGSPQSPT